MSDNFQRLKALLKELLQLDQPDLDFGLYRIMHAKRGEITQFLERDLLPQVKEAFAQYRKADKVVLETELAKAIEQAQALGAAPDSLPKVKALRAKLADEAVDLNTLEAEVYDHLYSFFRRYYSEGDFLSKRVYKPGVYAVPYEGEEVKFHWANTDQYYIKTSESLRDYSFRLRPFDEQNPMRVHFRLAGAAEGEHSNIKATEGKDRVFILARKDFISEENGELVIRFEYRVATLTDWPEDQREGKTKSPAQKELTALAESRVLAVADIALARWIQELQKPHFKAEDEQADYTRLRAHLHRYTARNTFDYFIHKDLGGFLRRELDFYIKNEVMHLDDVEHESAPRVEQYLSKIKVIRRVAGKVIDFLAQLENFQKKLWLKKKFVVDTQYCITLDYVPEAFYHEIAANKAQHEEWVRLCAIDKIKGDLTRPGYGVPLKPEFLKTHPTLVVDTRHFNANLTSRLLAAIGDVHDQMDGLLIHSENFQALSLIQARYREQVECIYIDPPYNTGDSEIPYKNTYLRSSWLALMESRLEMATRLLASDPVVFIAIDDFEMANLAKLMDSHYPSLRREMIIVNHHPQGGKAKTLAHTHEYMLACVSAVSDRTLIGRKSGDGVELRPFKRSGTAESNFRYGRPNSFYAILVEPDSRRIVGLEPPPQNHDYPTGPTKEGLIRVYPLGVQGEERVWRRSYESGLGLVQQGKLQCSEAMTIYQLIEAEERTAALFSNWVDPRYNSGTFGANLLRDIIGEQNPFSYPKSIHTVEDALFAAGLEDDTLVLDYFAGSGTTGHAVINLNRQDGGRRKFILVEMGDYFDTVLLPRIKKVTFAPEWKDGKPKRFATPEEALRSPRIVKVIRLESYEDALNNLETRRTETQQSLLALPQAHGTNGFKEQHLLRYMLDVETRGSQSLLNIGALTDPTAYRLKVKHPGSDENREVHVDLLETFNWLIGLTVRHIAAPQSLTAEFERDGEGRLRLKGRLRQDEAGPWWFRTVIGTTADGLKTLIIWRKRPGGETADGIERDNLLLDEWFTEQGYSRENSNLDLIYINGDNNLENLKAPNDTWKVRLIEEDFHRLIFDTERV
ncbi:MAG TPA: site-specific DNA-methyltransferase [Nitrospiraceae bacterium]|nr:site-specific DNA-methyltransferase [Nitrospiraceae bacterium]